MPSISGTHAATNTVLVTRNFKSFKSIPSPLCQLQARLHQALLAPEAIALREPFLPCITTSPDEHLTDALLEHLSQPPEIAIVQGKADPGTVAGHGGTFNDASTTSTHSASVKSTGSSGVLWTKDLAPDDVREVIFAPWSLHKAMEDASRADDAKGLAEATLMALACIIFETAHWLFERTQGHIARENLRATKRPVAELESLIAQRKQNDVGMAVLARLLGAEHEFLTFADGNTQLIKLRLPASHPPLFNDQTLRRIMSVKVPNVFDATPYGPSRLHTAPTWRQPANDTIVQISVVEAYCSHGKCESA